MATIIGTSANETFYTGNENDTFTGGGGSDIFVFGTRPFGNDLITDFSIDDKIDLSFLGVGDFDTLSRYISGTTSAVMNFGFADRVERITLDNFAPLSLTAANFVFNTSTASVFPANTGGADVLFGGNGNDVITAGAGADILNGGFGNDELYGGSASNVIYGNGDNDYLSGGAGNDTLFGDAGDDRLDGAADADRLTGGEGNDVFTSSVRSWGLDTIADFTAGDRIDLSVTGVPDFATLQHAGLIKAGFDSGSFINRTTISVGYGGIFEIFYVNNRVDLTASDFIFDTRTGPRTVLGSGGDDHLFGGSGDDRIDANGGNDIIYAGAGNDLITGVANNSGFNNYFTTVETGVGADVVQLSGPKFGKVDITDFDAASDKVDLSKLGVQDWATAQRFLSTGSSGAVFSLSSTQQVSLHVPVSSIGANNFIFGARETAIAGAAGVDVAFGSNTSDTIQGSNVANTFFGYDGDDTLVGAGGADVLIGGRGNDALYGWIQNYENTAEAPGTIDVAEFGIRLQDATFRRNQGLVQVHSAAEGSDTLYSIESLRFSDRQFGIGALSRSIDFNGDLGGDILFRNAANQYGSWQIQGGSLIGGGALGTQTLGTHLVGVGDINGDGHSDIVFRDETGLITAWRIDGTSNSPTWIGRPPTAGAIPIGLGDVNGDGYADLIVRLPNPISPQRALQYWTLRDSTVTVMAQLSIDVPYPMFRATADFNGDGVDDILVQSPSGDYSIYIPNNYDVRALGNPGLTSFVATGDFNGDGVADLLFRDADGTLRTWQINNFGVTSSGVIGNPGPTWAVVGVDDFNGDLREDLAFRGTDGTIGTWMLNGTAIIGGGVVGGAGHDYVPVGLTTPYSFPSIFFTRADGTVMNWQVSGDDVAGSATLGNAAGLIARTAGDFNNDGIRDLVFQDSGGAIQTWFNGGFHLLDTVSPGSSGPGWSVVGSGDFNGDGHRDLLFKAVDSDNFGTWDLYHSNQFGGGALGSSVGYSFRATGDLNGDGRDDILFQDGSGTFGCWLLDDTRIIGGSNIGNPGSGHSFVALGDVNGDGRADILTKDDSTGTISAWFMNGVSIIGGGDVGTLEAGATIAGVHDFNGDSRADLLFKGADGSYFEWLLDGTALLSKMQIGNPGPEWMVV